MEKLKEIERCNPIKKEKNDKKNIWDRTTEKIEHTADALGYGIEENIKNIVIALNVHGINTTASCEGHLEKNNYSAPWIQIEDPDKPKERFNGQNEAFRKVAEKYKLPVEEVKRMIPENAYWEALRECSKNGETKEFVKWTEESQKIMKIVDEILKDFYKNRKVSQNAKIRIEDNTNLGSFRIYSGGRDYQVLKKDLSQEERKQLENRIKLYRDEMNSFSEFLKNKFFAEGEEYLYGIMKKVQEEIDQEKIQKVKEKL